MDIKTLILWYAGCYIAGRGVAAAVYRVLRDGGHTRRNFQGRDIPASLGVCFALLAMIEAPAVAALIGPASSMRVLQTVVISCGFCSLGLLDDLIRNRERGGFSGHFKRLLKGGGVSTALIKAVFGLALCLGVSLCDAGGTVKWSDVAMNTLILALSANAVNLLDVKPGRAIKGFIVAMAIVIGGSWALQHAGYGVTVTLGSLVLLAPFVLWALATWRFDLGCRSMMGDAGSNTLGAILGLTLVWELSTPARAAALGLLIAYHLVAELGSLSAIISGVAPLRWLDNLGVRLLAKAQNEPPAPHKSDKCD